MRRSVGGILVGGLLVVQVVLGAVALRDDHSSGRVPDLPVTPAVPPVEPLTIDSALALSDPVASAWKDDARLVAASMEVVWPDDEEVVVPGELPGDGALTLVYAAEHAQLSLLMDRQTGTIYHAETGEWGLPVTSPLATDRIQRTASIAVLAAEVGYGTSYRAGCPEHRFVTRVHLAPSWGEGGNPAWVVSYVDERHRDRPDIRVVDAVTGRTLGGELSGALCEEEE